MGRAKGLRVVTTEDRDAASALTFRVPGSHLRRMGRKIEVVVHPAKGLRVVTTEDRDAASALTFRVPGSHLRRMGRKIEAVVHPGIWKAARDRGGFS